MQADVPGQELGTLMVRLGIPLWIQIISTFLLTGNYLKSIDLMIVKEMPFLSIPVLWSGGSSYLGACP